jgi:hypothetical protein
MDEHPVIGINEARALAEQLLTEHAARTSTDLEIDERATRDEDWCWVFFYNSRAYLETGDFSDALAGNGPLVVEKRTGIVHELTSAHPVEQQLRKIRNQ